MPNNNHNNNNRKRENSHNNHYNRFRGRNRHRDNYENKENGEVVDVRENNRENNDRRDSRDARENREHRDNQVINSFTLGTKELEGKNAEFQYDKGWYSIIDIVDEEKNVIYKSKNAQEAYTKWNVYIGRKKERSSKVEKAE